MNGPQFRIKQVLTWSTPFYGLLNGRGADVKELYID